MSLSIFSCVLAVVVFYVYKVTIQDFYAFFYWVIYLLVIDIKIYILNNNLFPLFMLQYFFLGLWLISSLSLSSFLLKRCS